MMKSMDPGAMADMLVATGAVKDKKAAEAAARQMNNLSESQIKVGRAGLCRGGLQGKQGATQRYHACGALTARRHAQALMVTANTVQQVAAWARKNVLLLLGVAVLLLALLLRWLGWM